MKRSSSHTTTPGRARKNVSAATSNGTPSAFGAAGSKLAKQDKHFAKFKDLVEGRSADRQQRAADTMRQASRDAGKK